MNGFSGPLHGRLDLGFSWYPLLVLWFDTRVPRLAGGLSMYPSAHPPATPFSWDLGEEYSPKADPFEESRMSNPGFATAPRQQTCSGLKRAF